VSTPPTIDVKKRLFKFFIPATFLRFLTFFINQSIFIWIKLFCQRLLYKNGHWKFRQEVREALLKPWKRRVYSNRSAELGMSGWLIRWAGVVSVVTAAAAVSVWRGSARRLSRSDRPALIWQPLQCLLVDRFTYGTTSQRTQCNSQHKHQLTLCWMLI